MKNLATAPYLLRAFLIWILLTAPPPPALLPSFPFMDAESRSPGTRPSQVIVLCFASLYPRVLKRTGELSGKSDEMQGEGNLAMD